VSYINFYNSEYARDRRMERFEKLVKSGRLEGMCGSEIEAMFGITREFSDSESV
jgi:hypothetical protein